MIPLLLALACIPIDGPKLLAKHFAAAIPEFAQLSPDTDLGYAPLPGVVRVVRADELNRIQSKYSIAAAIPTDGVCFEWPMRPMEVTQAKDAMKKALPATARVEVLEVSRAPVPDGSIEFPLAGLQGNIWRGVVRFGSHGRVDVWARVRVAVRQTRVLTRTALRAGEAITAAQLQVEEFEDTPIADLVTTVESAAGSIVKRPIRAGAVLKTQYLDHPSAISKGDTVRLRTSVGVAHVLTQVSAQARGNIGDIIPVKSAGSGRVLRARIEAPGEVRLAQ
jgi:flagella basal body P-ring formation protein FlgA